MISKAQYCEETRKTTDRAQGAVAFGRLLSVNSQEFSTNDDKDDDNSNIQAAEIPLEKAFLNKKFKSESESKLPSEHINLWKNMYRKKPITWQKEYLGGNTLEVSIDEFNKALTEAMVRLDRVAPQRNTEVETRWLMKAGPEDWIHAIKLHPWMRAHLLRAFINHAKDHEAGKRSIPMLEQRAFLAGPVSYREWLRKYYDTLREEQKYAEDNSGGRGEHRFRTSALSYSLEDLESLRTETSKGNGIEEAADGATNLPYGTQKQQPPVPSSPGAATEDGDGMIWS